jgi:hypothetical protein
LKRQGRDPILLPDTDRWLLWVGLPFILLVCFFPAELPEP